jgi:hypothetical protein
MDHKIEVLKKVVNDHYTNTFIWRIIDENNRVKAQGKQIRGKTSLEQGRKRLKRL